jgi:hypothetical protein
MDGSTLGLVAVFVSGYMLVTVPLMLVTGRILRRDAPTRAARRPGGGCGKR